MDENISSLPSIFRRHRWPAMATFVSVICGAIAYLVVTPSMYEAKMRIMLDKSQFTASEYGRDITQGSSIPYSNPLANQAELAQSQRVLEQALAQVSSKGITDLPQINAFRNNLTVSIVPATSILEMSYRSQNPLLTSGLLNALAETMIREDTESYRSQARLVREFLEIEVPQRRAQLAQAEAAESDYKKSSSVISLTAQTQSLVESLADLEAQERALSAQLQEAKTRDSLLRQTTDSSTLKNTYALVRSGQDEELKRLRAQLADLEAQATVSRTLLTDNNPVLLTLIEKRDATRALYTQKLSRLLSNNASTNLPSKIASDQVSQELSTRLILGDVERSGLEAKLGVVRRDRANLQTRLSQLPAKEQAFAALTRRREEAAASVDLLQRKLEEARIAEAQLGSNIKIIERALPPTASNWPRKSIVLVIANVAGIVLAIGVVLLLEVLDGTLLNATDAEKLVKLPVLGVLPVLPNTSLSRENSELFLKDSVLFESYLMLLKTMEFRSIEGLRIVVVSSTLSGEGKSVVVSHLATVSAMLFRRTLLIDADLRCPTQQKLFNLAAQPGLTDVIDGRVTLAEAVQRTSINHLSVLTCGEPREYPSQLLESARTRTLIAEAAAHYDLVIMDTPPITSCADATTLSRNSDGLLLVARPNFTQRDIMLQAVSQLTSNHVPIIGVAVNGITTQTEKYYRHTIQGYQALANR